MNHANFQQLISQFIDRELRAEEEEELFVHLASCSECREFLRQSVRLQAHLGASKVETMRMRQSGTGRAYISDRPALAGVEHEAKYARARTVAVLMIIVLFAGLLWSTTLPRQNSDHFDRSRPISPSEISTYQP